MESTPNTLPEAVAILGLRPSARLVDVSHTVLMRWVKLGAPKWRGPDVAKLIKAARKAQAQKAAA